MLDTEKICRNCWYFFLEEDVNMSNYCMYWNESTEDEACCTHYQEETQNDD